MIGFVDDFGLLKMSMNVAKFASGIRSGDLADDVVEGTSRRPFDSSASALSSVVRYLTSCQARSWCFAAFGIPMIVPLM